MGHIEHEALSPKTVNIAVITVSDSRTIENDESGSLIQQRLGAAGHKQNSYSLLPNDAPGLAAAVLELISESDLEAIIITGGTGLSSKDITVETIEPMFNKNMVGFGELFRTLSYQEIGPAAALSRAVGGVANRKVILCLPGSLGAVKLAMDKIILPELAHMVREASR